MSFIIQLFITALVVLALGNILPGASITNYWTALVVALVLAVLNAFLKPLLQFISFPITIITLGLFLFVINAVIILLTSELVEGFKVNGFWAALLFSLCLSFAQSIIESLTSK
ncbi:MAG: phage holin family protein [Capnocytophaga sp.]|nr:phage holin family protein [Capnocytophaga sp.]